MDYKEFKKKNDGKKTVVIYGNCHSTAIRKVLENYSFFTDKYAIFPIKAIQDVNDPSYLYQECFSDCDVFIHQSIQLNNRYGKEYASENIIKRLKTTCNIIAIPNVYHLPMCFFPQYSEKREFKNRSDFTIFFRDEIIDSAYKRGFSVDRIFAEYCDSNRFSAGYLDTLFDTFFSKLYKREQEWDIKVSGFVMSNFTQYRLFYDPNHPTHIFILYIVEKLLKLLDVYIDEIVLNNVSPMRLDTFEMPICESVYQHWNMSFERENLRQGQTGIYNDLDLKKYIRRYCNLEWQNNELLFFLRAYSGISYFYQRLKEWQ